MAPSASFVVSTLLSMKLSRCGVTNPSSAHAMTWSGHSRGTRRARLQPSLGPNPTALPCTWLLPTQPWHHIGDARNPRAVVKAAALRVRRRWPNLKLPSARLISLAQANPMAPKRCAQGYVSVWRHCSRLRRFRVRPVKPCVCHRLQPSPSPNLDIDARALPHSGSARQYHNGANRHADSQSAFLSGLVVPRSIERRRHCHKLVYR